MRILVIDDNPDDRQLELREVYALFPDADVVELADYAAFEAALALRAPDLVLTDLDLRWGNGREILTTVKARYPACPVVMFTGTGDETIAVELMKAGLDDYVVKSPRQLARLRTSLKIAVEHATARVALSEREMHLARSLAQQQTIVRELHHRVKNNLQTVASLLHMRARTAGEATRTDLNEIAGRMEALGAVQARIYESAQLDRVDFSAALLDIATSLTHVHRNGLVTLAQRLERDLELDVARAMPLSLLCYEIILNAMKHAWPSGAAGVLSIEILLVDHHDEIRISDDGVGFVEQSVKAGLGTRLVRNLAGEAGVAMVRSSAPEHGTFVTLRVL